MTKVSLTVWRDAKTDPPNHDRYVWTDIGESTYWGKCWLQNDEGEVPTVWCDPTPPGDDALRQDDLRNVLEFAHRGGMDTSYILAAQEAWHRLRRALKEAEGT